MAVAIPAIKAPITITQADGSTLEVRLIGDEHYHYYTTLDGTPLIMGANGMYREATMLETIAMNERRAKRLNARNRVRAQRNTQNRASIYTGKHKGLVILVNFNDKSMLTTSTWGTFHDMFNKEGYNKNNHIGSVRDYFLAQSYDQLDIEFDVVGPYTLSKNMSYYGKNDADGYDSHPAEMVIEAVRMANPEVNYKDYDWDGNGEVDQVYVIFAGYSEAAGAPSNTIWPHEWDLESAKYGGDGTGALYLDGVWINTYACSNELLGITGNTINPIGTAVHEFSHCLGLPDMYDTEGNNFGMGCWSVLDQGCYNGPRSQGEVPASYTSYERMYAGWIKPTELKSAHSVRNMQTLADSQEAYIIYNDANRNEYYLLENHQKTGWDKYSYGHGMLIIHVDYDEDAWFYNVVNNTANHQRCTIIPADNQLNTGYIYANDLAGDPYPGTSGNTSLTDVTRPAARLYNANSKGRKYMGKPIEYIREANGLISFNFMGGLPQTDVNQDGTIDTQDVLQVWQYIQGGKTPSGALPEDADNNGTVDTQDILAIYEGLSIQ